jgi:hypothetical protein
MNAMQKSLSLACALALALSFAACDDGGGGGGTAPTDVTQPPSPAAATPTPAPTPTPPPSVSGSWDSEARRWHFRLQQQGSRISGQLLGYRDVYYSNPDHGDLAITGTVSSTGAITFGCAAFAVNFDGRIDSASRMTGTLYDCGNGCRNYGDVMVKTAN